MMIRPRLLQLDAFLYWFVIILYVILSFIWYKKIRWTITKVEFKLF